MPGGSSRRGFPADFPALALGMMLSPSALRNGMVSKGWKTSPFSCLVRASMSNVFCAPSPPPFLGAPYKDPPDTHQGWTQGASRTQ